LAWPLQKGKCAKNRRVITRRNPSLYGQAERLGSGKSKKDIEIIQDPDDRRSRVAGIDGSPARIRGTL
jgi:hypothetical protein